MKTLLSLSLLLLAATARAAGDNEVSLRLGAYGPGGMLDYNMKEEAGEGGGYAGLRYLLKLDKLVWLGVQLDGMNGGEHDSTTLLTDKNSHSELKESALLVVAKFQFRDGKTLRPYLLGGLGLHTAQVKLTAAPVAGKTWSDTGTVEQRTLIDDKQTGFGQTVEAGLDWYFAEHFGASTFLAVETQGRSKFQSTAAAKSVGIGDSESAFGGLIFGVALAGRF